MAKVGMPVASTPFIVRSACRADVTDTPNPFPPERAEPPRRKTRRRRRRRATQSSPSALNRRQLP